MLAARARIRGISVFRRFVPVIGVVSGIGIAAIFPGPTRGQVNIDQGKSASELFANDCAACHKSTRGLANGRNSLTLSLFLREHYAASSQQAAALAAYVIGAGGNAPAAKPDQRAKSEEPKGQEAKGQEAKGQEAKGQEAKGQETRGQETRGQETRGQETRGQDAKGHEAKPRAASVSPKPELEKPARMGEPGHAVEPAHEEGAPAQQEPAPVVAAPITSPPSSATDAPELRPTTTSAGVPTDAQSNDSEPVPRDNIPD
jgi:hypothetical protein